MNNSFLSLIFSIGAIFFLTKFELFCNRLCLRLNFDKIHVRISVIRIILLVLRLRVLFLILLVQQLWSLYFLIFWLIDKFLHYEEVLLRLVIVFSCFISLMSVWKNLFKFFVRQVKWIFPMVEAVAFLKTLTLFGYWMILDGNWEVFFKTLIFHLLGI